jgi:hypothetical protein
MTLEQALGLSQLVAATTQRNGVVAFDADAYAIQRRSQSLLDAID